MRLFKKISVMLLTVAFFGCLIGMESSAVTVPLGGTGYTSCKELTGSRHSTYYCKLDSVKFDNLSLNYIPSGSYVYARIRTAGGTKAGDLASFSKVGQGYNYSYYSNYGYAGTYKIGTNSNVRLAYTCSFTWNP